MNKYEIMFLIAIGFIMVKPKKEEPDLREATAWLSYNAKEHAYKHNHIEMHHVPEDQERPKSKGDKVDTMYKSMKWKKLYGYYNPETTQFQESKRLNR